MKKVITDLVDFHSHILPEADHGSTSVETSLFQLHSAYNNGVRRIVATPHFYPNSHSVDSFLERRNRAFCELYKSMTPELPKIKLGAEVLICGGIENMENIDKLFIEGTNVLLLELPFSNFESSFANSVDKLVTSGVNVILAHADRYPTESVERLIACGAKIQLNAASLAGCFRQRRLYDWMSRGCVVALGSDIHGNDKRAYKLFNSAIAKIGDNGEYIKSESDKIWSEARYHN